MYGSSRPDPYFGSGTLLRRALKKYGKENFTKRILMECDTKEELDYFEKFFIAAYDAVNSSVYYNIAEGGHGGFTGNHTEKTKQRLSENHKGIQFTEERKRNISKANKGRIFSEKHKQNISKNHADVSGENNPMYGDHRFAGENNPMYGVHRYGVDSPFYGHEHTEESIKKMKENSPDRSGKNNPMYGVDRSGEKNPMFGRQHTEESKKRNSESNKAAWQKRKNSKLNIE